MNTKQFQYVLTLAREGSFSKAADKLGITQSGLTHMMNSLEKEIGFPITMVSNGPAREDIIYKK